MDIERYLREKLNQGKSFFVISAKLAKNGSISFEIALEGKKASIQGYNVAGNSVSPIYAPTPAPEKKTTSQAKSRRRRRAPETKGGKGK